MYVTSSEDGNHQTRAQKSPHSTICHPGIKTVPVITGNQNKVKEKTNQKTNKQTNKNKSATNMVNVAFSVTHGEELKKPLET